MPGLTEQKIAEADAPGNIAASWMQYFRFLAFGFKPPRVAVEIVPTIQVDDNSNGPFPVYRPFTGGLVKAGVAANFTEFEIVNLDDRESRSVLVIDWLQFFTFGAVANVLHGLTQPASVIDATFLAANGALMLDQGSERDGAAINANDAPAGLPTTPRQGPRLSTQGIWARNVAAATLAENVNASSFPVNDNLPHRIDGPWLIGPGSCLMLEPDTANVGMRIYVRGRYYPGRYTTL